MNIKMYRRWEGLSQTELAEKLGVTQGAVHQWEAGITSPSGRTAAAIVRLTDGQVAIEDLYPAQEEEGKAA